MVLCRPFLSSRTTHPPLISLCRGWAALEPWGLLRKRGLELPAPIAGQGLDPLLLLQGLHTHCPTSVFCLPSSSFQGRKQAHDGCRQSGLYANEGFCAHQPHGHCALCSGLLCWDRVGCQ